MELCKESPNNAEVQINAEVLRMKAKEPKASRSSNSALEDAELFSGVFETPNGGSLRPKFGALEAEP